MSLTLHIFSFGFHRSGPPADASGNRGGFVFDCRLLPNPGQDVRFAHATGLDPEVVAWLETRPVTTEFLSGIEALLRQTMARYIERDFTDLYVAFGCTGGQHRSVYCAAEITRRMRDLGMQVDLEHCEQESWR